MTTANVLPKHRDAYYGGRWHPPARGAARELVSPGDASSLGTAAECGAEDVDAAVAAARAGFEVWRDFAPRDRGRLLRELAARVREHAGELALIDALDCGNPVSATGFDVELAVESLDFFAGLVTEMKGATVPLGPEALNFALREPLGVVARIYPFNHPLLFCVSKLAAPLAAGNSVILKPPEQAPLSTLRFLELADGILPPGVVGALPGGREVGAALVAHPGVSAVAFTGSAAGGRAVMRGAADTLKRLSLELGGKNALIAFPDADLERLVDGIVRGMNFHWSSGQSCGSTSRVFLHADIHDAVAEAVAERCRSIRQGLPSDPASEMGALIDAAQLGRVTSYVESGKQEGASVLAGGGRPPQPELASGFFLQPTVFANVTQAMTIAREEIFGPVVSLLRWSDERAMLADVNAVEYGLTASIWTRDVTAALRTASRVEAGYVWINDAGPHHLGTPFGGRKQSGVGREECLDELLSFTDQKTITVRL